MRSEKPWGWTPQGIDKGLVFLEVKRRQYGVVAKSRLALEPARDLETMTFHDIVAGVREAISPELGEIWLAHSRPTVMTQY